MHTTPIELRVMTYQTRHAHPPSRPDSIDVDAIVRAIVAEEPDLALGTGKSG